MYEETKIAVKKAFEVGRILFSLGIEKYNKLLEITKKIKAPSLEELNKYVESGLSVEDAFIFVLKDRYKKAAVSAGFTERQGLAMLDYAAMLEEMDNE